MLERIQQLGILHGVVTVLSMGLIICLFVQAILSWVLQGRDNRVSRFLGKVTGPIVEPLDRLLPQVSIGGMRVSIGFIVAFWAVWAVGILLEQALPLNW
ncbi:MAG TPA: YggT family protein [Ktedonobacterales bacterium]